MAQAKTNYTQPEIMAMTDEDLLTKFTEVTGHTTLGCKHCKKTDKPISFFVSAIRTRCEKTGLFKDMKLPLTCDRQQLTNRLQNPLVNPVNNKYYPKIRAAEAAGNSEELEAARIARSLELYEKTGKFPRVLTERVKIQQVLAQKASEVPEIPQGLQKILMRKMAAAAQTAVTGTSVTNEW